MVMVKPDRTEHLDPAVWSTTTDYQPADLETVLATADAGQLESLADLCDAMLTDDRIRGVLQTRLNTVLGLNNNEWLSFESQAVRIRKAVETDWFISCPENELSILLRWGLLLGIGVAQRVVVQKDGRWIPQLKTWHPRWLSYDFSTRLWDTYTYAGERVILQPDDPHWILFQPYGESRPWANGIWRSLGLYWLAKQAAIRAWARHQQVLASGAIVGRLPPGKPTTDPDTRKFWNDIRALGKNARIVLPEGYDLEFMEAETEAWATFDELIKHADTAIAVSILGQPLTTEVPAASQTGAQAASAVRQDYLEFDAEQLASWGHEHLKVWAFWNFGDPELSPWPQYRVEPPDDLSAMSTSLKNLGDALEKLTMHVPEGQQIDTEVLYDRYGVPLKKAPPKEPTPPENQNEPV